LLKDLGNDVEFRIAKLDRTSIAISGVVAVLLLGLTVFFLTEIPNGWIFSILMILILLGSYVLSPRTYYFEGSRLIIEKFIGRKIIIPLGEIRGYSFIPDFAKLKPIRAFGNGGLFGYYGLFVTPSYGMINCQMRSLKGIFIIKTKEACYAISPLEPERFEDHFKTVVAGAGGNLEPLTTSNPDWQKKADPAILIIPVLILIITIAMVFTVYPQLPERIATHFNAEGMPDGWGTKDSFLIFGIIPQALLTIVVVLSFLILRNLASSSIILKFLIIIFSLVQIIIAYANLDIFWFNTQHRHLLPLGWLMIGFILIMVISLLAYYQKIRQPKTR
jgi:hypothetical protein